MIPRGIATFIGAFTLLNLGGSLIFRGFDANFWWIDFNPLPSQIASIVLLAGGAGALVYAARPPRHGLMREVVLAPIALMAMIAIANALRFYGLLHHHLIATTVPLPFSAIVVAALIWIGFGILRPTNLPEMRRHRAAGVATFIICIIGFPLAQMYFFGHTDYRRKADAIVVFGARAYADGSPSPVLADRVATGCALYRDGLANVIIFSGGPGDGAVDEPHTMRRLAMKLGVPDSAIWLDSAGLNTDATVRNTTSILNQAHLRRVLAVSHSYHLPRVKMAYRHEGWDVYTVPAVEHSRLPGGGRFLVFRELIALWAYYLHPLAAAKG